MDSAIPVATFFQSVPYFFLGSVLIVIFAEPSLVPPAAVLRTQRQPLVDLGASSRA